jgi:hypothetical protein
MAKILRHKKKIIWAAIVLATFAFAIISYQISFSPIDAAHAVGSTQIVEVVVPERSLAIEFATPNDNYHTKNATFTVGLTARGVGTITITDQNGNVLWAHEKITDAEETLTAQITLRGDPGDYVLSATIAHGDETANSALRVIYEATEIPTLPIFPNTGAYIRIANRAVPLNQILSLAVCLLAVGLVVSLVIRQLTRRKACAKIDAVGEIKK